MDAMPLADKRDPSGVVTQWLSENQSSGAKDSMLKVPFNNLVWNNGCSNSLVYYLRK